MWSNLIYWHNKLNNYIICIRLSGDSNMLYLHVLHGFECSHWRVQDPMTQFRICENLVILLTWYWVSRVMDFFSQFQSNPTSSKEIFALTLWLLQCMGNVLPSDYVHIIFSFTYWIKWLGWSCRLSVFTHTGVTCTIWVLFQNSLTPAICWCLASFLLYASVHF